MDLVIPALTAACMAAAYVAPQALQPANRRFLLQRCRTGRAVALTYDDGPGEDLTPRILDLLGSRGAKATFFVMGKKAAGSSQLIERARREGHEIAAHSQHHLSAWTVWPWRSYADVVDGFTALRRAGQSPVWLRPPYGRITIASYVAARRCGAKFAWWTHDSGDTRRVLPSPIAVAERVVENGGGVVLMHDFDRSALRADFVLQCTACILDAAYNSGLRAISLSSLLAA